MRPGTNVTVQNALPPTTPPIDTGTWFVAGITSQGPIAPQSAASFAQWEAIYGGRGTNPIMSDSVETYFNQGGTRVYTARTVGPAALPATVVLKDVSAANTLNVSAIGPGTYANGYHIVVAATADSGFTLTVEDAASNILEESNDLQTVADAVAYGASSSYVTVTAVGTTQPVVGTFALASGADDTASITTTQYTNSLALFVRDLGPGRVSCPGATTTAILTAVAQHCSSAGPAGFRVGIGDLPDSTSAATLTGDAAPLRSLGSVGRCIGLFTPWVDIAPVAGSAGNRAVPPSAFYCGLAAKSDSATANPNLPIAGVNGILTTAVAVHASFSDSDRETLNTAGVNVIRPMSGGFRIYGNVTVVDRIKDPLYFQLSNVSLDMAILAQANAVQEEYMFSQIDGNGIDAANFGSDLTNMMSEWQALGALFPNPAGVYFLVDTTVDVNTPTTESEGELIATLAYSRAPGAEQVNLNIVRASAATGV